MRITKQELIKMKASRMLLGDFIDQMKDTDEPVDVGSLIDGKITYGSFLWLAGNTLTRERIVRFACDCALMNVELMKPYTENYNMIVEFLKNPTAHPIETVRGTVEDSLYSFCFSSGNPLYGTKNAARAENAARAVYSAVLASSFSLTTFYVSHSAFSAHYAASVASREKVNALLTKLFE